MQSGVHELDVRREATERLIELLVAVVRVVQHQYGLHQLGMGVSEDLLRVAGLWQSEDGGIVVVVG